MAASTGLDLDPSITAAMRDLGALASFLDATYQYYYVNSHSLPKKLPARGHATSGRMIPKLEAPPLPSLLSLSLSLYMSVAPFASLHICLWFVTRGRKGLWANSRQHSILL